MVDGVIVAALVVSTLLLALLVACLGFLLFSVLAKSPQDPKPAPPKRKSEPAKAKRAAVVNDDRKAFQAEQEELKKHTLTWGSP